jgi:hypothetical protein
MNHRPQYKRPSFKDTVVTVAYAEPKIQMWLVVLATGETTTVMATTRPNAVTVARGTFGNECFPTRSVTVIAPTKPKAAVPAVPAWFVAKLAADKLAKAEAARKATLPIPPCPRARLLFTPTASPQPAYVDIIERLANALGDHLPDNRPDLIDDDDTIEALMGVRLVYDPTENWAHATRSERLVSA